MTWPKNPNKYQILSKIIDFNSEGLFKFTLWQTDIKNIHFTFWALRYADSRKFTRGKEYYIRGRHFLASIGLLTNRGTLTKSGEYFLDKCLAFEKEDPGYFKDDVNPFELEKDLYEITIKSGNKEYRDNIDYILINATNFDVEDIEEIITIQRIYNSKTSLKNYFSLSKKDRILLRKELQELAIEFYKGGRLNKLKNNCTQGWLDFLFAFSKGMLGFQNDGYYRGQNFIKCRILELAEGLVKKAPHTFNIGDLYKYHKGYISRNSFIELIKQSPRLEARANLFYIRKSEIREPPTQEIIEDNESTFQVTKVIQSELSGLNEKERSKELEKRLAELEKIAVIQRKKKTDIRITTNKQNRRCRRASALLLERFNYTCQLCNYSFEKEYGTKWNIVHHIEPIKTIQNNKPSNLLVVDPNCHAMIECGRISIIKKGDFLETMNVFSKKTKTIKQNKF